MFEFFTLRSLIDYKHRLSELINDEMYKDSDFYYMLIEHRNEVSNEINYRIKRGFIFHER